MQIGKKGFPYPVLNNAKNFNCYVNDTYALELEEIEDGENSVLKNVHIETNSKLIKELLINSVFKNPNILMLQLKNERLNLIRYVPNPKFSSSAIIRVEKDKNLIPQAPSNLC